MSNYIFTSNGELYHYGIKGQKWGVRRVLDGAAKVYTGVGRYGQNVMERKAQKYDYRSQVHAQKGHKLRSKYYDRKSYKTRDRSYDDLEAFTEGIKDLSLKAGKIASLARVGALIIKNRLP